MTVLVALFGHTLLFQPGWTVETGVFLDRPVNALGDARAVDRYSACSVRKLVLPLLLAVLRVGVDGRPAQRGLGNPDDVEPEPLDLTLPLDVIREEVAGHSDVFFADTEVRFQELREEPNHLRI